MDMDLAGFFARNQLMPVQDVISADRRMHIAQIDLFSLMGIYLPHWMRPRRNN